MRQDLRRDWRGTKKGTTPEEGIAPLILSISKNEQLFVFQCHSQLDIQPHHAFDAVFPSNLGIISIFGIEIPDKPVELCPHQLTSYCSSSRSGLPIREGKTWSIKKFSLFQGPLTPLTLVTGSKRGNTKSSSFLKDYSPSPSGPVLVCPKPSKDHVAWLSDPEGSKYTGHWRSIRGRGLA